ncbi:MAG: hypothetical protein KatS3mg003_1349 [Candidatus Nitrosocaldaceae archaeon]|nr:MAG: hypothetical protein KatS3mg003_1349 [Candidatus Nitrosocaldaceae archaeon]
MKVNKVIIALLAIAVLGTTVTVSTFSTITTAQMEHTSHDSETILLDYQRIRPNQFIMLYDTTPMPITSGHIAINVDCNDEGVAPVELAIGVAPEMEFIKLSMENMIHHMSEHGKMCLYHVDLPPEEGMEITDIALINNSDKWVRLGPEASMTIHVHGLGEPIEGHESMDHGSMEGM